MHGARERVPAPCRVRWVARDGPGNRGKGIGTRLIQGAARLQDDGLVRVVSAAQSGRAAGRGIIVPHDNPRARYTPI